MIDIVLVNIVQTIGVVIVNTVHIGVAIVKIVQTIGVIVNIVQKIGVVIVNIVHTIEGVIHWSTVPTVDVIVSSVQTANVVVNTVLTVTGVYNIRQIVAVIIVSVVRCPCSLLVSQDGC